DQARRLGDRPGTRGWRGRRIRRGAGDSGSSGCGRGESYGEIPGGSAGYVILSEATSRGRQAADCRAVEGSVFSQTFTNADPSTAAAAPPSLRMTSPAPAAPTPP